MTNAPLFTVSIYERHQPRARMPDAHHRRCAPRLERQQPRLTAPTLALRCRAKNRHASAAPLAGLVSFATAPFRSVAISQAAFPLRCIPMVTNCRDRHGQRCTRRFKTPEAAMLRISANQQYGARLRLSPKTAAIARDASHGQDAAIVAVTVQLSRRSAGCVCETGRHRWKN